MIDVDFGPVTVNIARPALSEFPDGTAGNQATFGGSGTNQFIRSDAGGVGTAGSFIQFERLDLDYMTMNNEVMQPVEVSVQRSASTPYGTHENGNNFDTIQEFILIASRPLNNEDIAGAINPYDTFNEIGLNRGSTAFGGVNAGGLTHEQNIYAERRQYAFTNTTGATLSNGELVSAPAQSILASIFSAPQLLDINTWGSLSAITGPNLYCYRIVYSSMQSFKADQTIFTNVGFEGFTSLRFPPVSVAFLCKDPNYTEGEYLTRLANAMNSIPEDGPTA